MAQRIKLRKVVKRNKVDEDARGARRFYAKSFSAAVLADEEIGEGLPKPASDVEYGWFESRLRIDKHGLDEALVEHPEMFAKVANQTALGNSRRDGMKDELKRVDGQLYIRLKAEYEERGERVTEAVVKAAVVSHALYRKVSREYLDACLEAERWGALREAFSQKGYALKDLCELWRAGYWGINQVRGEAADAGKRQLEQNRATIHAARQQRGAR